MKSGKRKRKSYAENMDTHTKEVIDNAIRIRTKMRVRDCAGNVRLFRSTILEEGAENEENEGDTG